MRISNFRKASPPEEVARGGMARATTLFGRLPLWTLVSLVGLARVSASAQPANDLCSAAIALTAGLPYTMDTAGATGVADPRPVCQTNFGAGVWFSFIPASNGVVEVSTCGSDFDTCMQVYTGDCGGLTQVPSGCNDDEGPVCFVPQASVRFSGSSGISYKILVGGYGGESGLLHIEARTVPPPPNDTCSDAIALAPGVAYRMDTAGASSLGDPVPACQTNFGAGVWFSFAASGDGLIEVSTCGSNFDTVLGVYSRCSASSALDGACYDDDGPVCFGSQASVRFIGRRGSDYYILVGGWNKSGGALQIQARMLSPPANDVCPGAIALPPNTPFSIDTRDATSTADPLPGCRSVFGNGVWFIYTPASNGPAEVSTCGSDFDTVLQVYTGSCASLSPIADGCNDQNGPVCMGLQASLRFDAATGTKYFILAGGLGAATGHLQIQAGTLSPPANDSCSGAIILTNAVPYSMDTVAAASAGDPLPACQASFGRGVWFSFTATENGLAEVSTCGSDFDTVLQVYAGACGSLSPIENGCVDQNGPVCLGSQASVRFDGIAGANYYILVRGYNGRSGTLRIQARTVPPPPNNACSGAVVLTDDVPFTMDTAGAASGGDPVPPCQTNLANDIWFSFTAGENGMIEVSTCQSDFDTALEVFSGSCDALAVVPEACNDDNGPVCGTSRASLRFLGSTGTTYYILAGGFLGRSGILEIKARTLAPLPNDVCAGAIMLTSGVPHVLDTAGAISLGDLTPECQALFGGGVWFRFTAGDNGPAEVSTCGSDFDTVLQVYSGDCDSLWPVPESCNDQDGPICSGAQASTRFDAAGGSTYYVLAGGYRASSGILRIEVRSMSPPSIHSVIIQADQTLVVNCSGRSDANYILQACTNLVDWTDLAQQTAAADGSLQFSINAQPENGALFFRLKLQSP